MSEIEISSVMLGFGIMVGLALLFSAMISYKQDQEIHIDMSMFISFLTIFCGFVVWGGLMYEWVLFLCLIILAIILGFEVKRNRGGDV